MKILFADTFPDPQIERLREHGYECVLRPEVAGQQLAETVPGFDVLSVRSTRVDAATLEASDLELVIRAGAGYNTIDVAAAADLGIFVCNVPGKNAAAVAELAFGLLLAIDRSIPDNVADLRAGRWNKRRYQKASGLLGRSVGVVGLGAIGLSFAERAHAFNMKVHVIDRPGRSEATVMRLAELSVVHHTDLPSLARTCDVLSFHVPADPGTKGMIGDDLLQHVSPGTVILNTARGDIVDEEALLAVLDEKNIRVGIDVYLDEPAVGQADFTSALAQHPNVYGTHHIGASTEQAQNAIADEVVNIIETFCAGEIRNSVNLDSLRGSSTLVVRHVNEVGVLARVLQALSAAGINIEQMENRIFSGGRAASATIQLSGTVDEQLKSDIEALGEVIGVALEVR